MVSGKQPRTLLHCLPPPNACTMHHVYHLFVHSCW
jgi:hypothetical protein